MPKSTVILGDCVEEMAAMPEDSVDAVVTDPPSGIGFMGKEWDHHKGGRDNWIAWLTEVMREALRVAKPGAHAFVWALPRTSHWTAFACEDAGWTIREVCHHIFGSGFPKSKNLGNGFGTALKPAVENWILCRAPLSESSATANFEKHGTGAINVDASRVGSGHSYSQEQWSQKGASRTRVNTYGTHRPSDTPLPSGRWPANLLLSHSEQCVRTGTKRVSGTNIPSKNGTVGSPSFGGHTGNGRGKQVAEHYADPDGTEEVASYSCVEDCPVRLLDEQSGVSVSKRAQRGDGIGSGYAGSKSAWDTKRGFEDKGGASRFFKTFDPDPSPGFFYCAKSSRRERNQGLEGMPEGRVEGSGSSPRPAHGQRRDGINAANTHPTVKPLALMRYLVRMVCPPGGTILDPFAGSGSTLVAAIQEGFDCVGIEQDEEYAEIARARIAHALEQGENRLFA